VGEIWVGKDGVVPEDDGVIKVCCCDEIVDEEGIEDGCCGIAVIAAIAARNAEETASCCVWDMDATEADKASMSKGPPTG
jgi:hypothetical protein